MNRAVIITLFAVRAFAVSVEPPPRNRGLGATAPLLLIWPCTDHVTSLIGAYVSKWTPL
jgi:hypothetical protein